MKNLAAYIIMIVIAAPMLILSLIFFGYETTWFLVFAAIVYWVGKRLWKLYRMWISIRASRDDPEAMALEALKFKSSLFKFLGAVVGVAVFCLGIYLCIQEGGGFEGATATVIVAVLCALPFELAGMRRWRQYHEKFKDGFVADALSKVFDDLRYEPNGRFDEAALRDLDFFAHFDGYGGNDLIEAAYKGIRFVQGDVRIQELYTVTVRDSQGNTRTEIRSGDVFRGRVMRFEFVDRFRGPVQVISRGFSGAKLASSPGDWQAVETELAAFRDRFLVFARDPLDAMAALTPPMIEGIFYLGKALDVPMAFYFAGNTMTAMLATGREAFDVSAGKTLLEERKLLRRDVALITGFLDTMYFRPQEEGEDAAARPRTMEERLAAAAAIADVAGPSGGEKIAWSAKRAARKTVFTVRALFPFAIVLIFLVSAVYAMIYVPDGFRAGASYSAGEWRASGMTVPIMGYLVVGGLFIVATAFSAPIISLVLLAIHLLFLVANIP